MILVLCLATLFLMELCGQCDQKSLIRMTSWVLTTIHDLHTFV